MFKKIIAPFFWVSSLYAWEKPEVDPFEPLSSIPASELLPKGVGFSIAKDGSLMVNGKPRYFPAVIWYGDTQWGYHKQGRGGL